MQIKDIMAHDVVAVSEDTPITEVAKLLVDRNIHAVPVLDSDRKVVGLVSETDFFLKNSVALHLPTYVEIIQKEMHSRKDSGEIPSELQGLLSATAKDIMTEKCVTIPEVASVQDLLTLVILHHFKSFPVTDYQGVLVGIVALIDIIPFLSETKPS